MAACNLKLGGEACHSAVRGCQGLWLSHRRASCSFCWPRTRGIPIPVDRQPATPALARRSRRSIDPPRRSVARITVISTRASRIHGLKKGRGGAAAGGRELQPEGCPRGVLNSIPRFIIDRHVADKLFDSPCFVLSLIVP